MCTHCHANDLFLFHNKLTEFVFLQSQGTLSSPPNEAHGNKVTAIKKLLSSFTLFFLFSLNTSMNIVYS